MTTWWPVSVMFTVEEAINHFTVVTLKGSWFIERQHIEKWRLVVSRGYTCRDFMLFKHWSPLCFQISLRKTTFSISTLMYNIQLTFFFFPHVQLNHTDVQLKQHLKTLLRMGEEAKQSIQDNQILPEHLQKTKKKKKKGWWCQKSVSFQVVSFY